MSDVMSLKVLKFRALCYRLKTSGLEPLFSPRVNLITSNLRAAGLRGRRQPQDMIRLTLIVPASMVNFKAVG